MKNSILMAADGGWLHTPEPIKPVDIPADIFKEIERIREELVCVSALSDVQLGTSPGTSATYAMLMAEEKQFHRRILRNLGMLPEGEKGG